MLKISAMVKRMHDTFCLDVEQFKGHVNDFKTHHTIQCKLAESCHRYKIKDPEIVVRKNPDFENLLCWAVRFRLEDGVIWILSYSGIKVENPCHLDAL